MFVGMFNATHVQESVYETALQLIQIMSQTMQFIIIRVRF